MTDRNPKHLLPGVQGLRAAAAFSVAFVHITHDAIAGGADPAGWLQALTNFMPWDAGVDVFFVISGFVIVHSSAPLFGKTGGPLIFLRRRLTRIIPLYWLCTLAFLAVLMLGHGAIHGDIGGAAFILASFLFVPWPRPDGIMQPAFGLGWTLNYEMFFYIVFTLFLLLPRRAAVAITVIAFAGFVVLGQVRHFASPQLSFWASPLILEFCAGMVLAQAKAARICLSGPVRLALVAVAVIALHLCTHAASDLRPLAFGIPAFLLVAAATLGPPPTAVTGLSRSLIRLGDASYAMYLFHPFVMRALSIAWQKFHSEIELAGIIYVVVGLAVAQAGALIINTVLERRLTALFRRPPGAAHEVV